MSRVMAVDIGASSYRVIEGTYREGRLAMKVLARYKHGPILEGGRYHWDVYGMARNMAEVIRQAAMKGEPVLSIGFDSFGTDFGLLDESGQLLDKPLAYRDSISDGMYEKYFREEERRYPAVGGTFWTTCTAHILKGMEETDYEPLKKARHLLFMPDLMAFFFTGKTVNETTIATTSRLLNIGKREWDYAFIESLGLSGSIFHPLKEAGTMVGRLREEIAAGVPNLKDTAVIAAACHDTASAVVTIPELPACSFISSGTWSVKGIVADAPYVSTKARDYKMCNEGQPWGKYRLIRNITGLWLVEECTRYWKQKGMDILIPELARQAQKEAAFPSMIYTDAPDFARQGDMPEKIRAYCQRTGQEMPEHPVEVMQTIIQGLACEYRRHNEQLLDVTGERIRTVYIVGGGRNNRYLNQCTANATGCRVIAGHPEATAMGNMLVQLLAHGDIESVEAFSKIAGRDVAEEIYKPEDRQEWKREYAFYQQLAEI